LRIVEGYIFYPSTLGYIVSQRGIEPNPEKVAALERMGPIRDLKGVQKVLGCLATMSRFISQLGD
jgi:hypothetical protein